MEIKMYLQMLRKGWWIIALTALIAVNASLIYCFTATPSYSASAKFLVSPNTKVLGDQQQTISSLDVLGQRSVVATYAEFMNSDKVFQEALKVLNLNKDQLKDYNRSTTILPDARILVLTVDGPDPKMCSVLANTIGEQGVVYIAKYYQLYDINPLDLSVVPVVPDSPKPVRDTLLALLFGLLLGGGLAIISEQVLAPLENYRRRQHLDNQSFAYNRQYTERLLELEMMRSRNKSDVFSLGLVRLDGLVDYLDSMPQIMVQRILQQVTSTLKMELKGTDLVGRWAGQATFAIILPSTPFNAANSLMDRIRQKLSEPMKVGESDELISLNPYVGVARSKENETIDAFVARTQKDLDENMFTVPSQTASPTNIKSVKPEING